MAHKGSENAFENGELCINNQDTSSDSFCYDKVMDHLGQFGKFQLRAFLWLCIPMLFPGVVVMSSSFIGALPDHRCYIEGCDDEDSIFMPLWINNTVALSDGKINHCTYYNDTSAQDSQNCSYPRHNFSVISCKKLVYDNSKFESTIATEFGLVCDEEWKLTLVNSVFMFGTLVGAGTLGHLADVIGRKLAFMLSVLILGSSMLGVAFSVNFFMFLAMRFLCGVSCVGLFDIAFVWGIESVGKKYKIICGLVYQITFSIGACILGLVAYYVRNWRTLQLIVSIPILLTLTTYWVVPESIRWLASKHRYAKVQKLVTKAAKENGKGVPYHLLAEMVRKKSNEEEPPVPKETVLDILAVPILLRRVLIMFFTWIAAVMGYYGLVFSSSTLSSKFYLNYELTMLVDVPAYITGSIVINRIGRRSTISSSLILSGVACFLTGLIPEDIAVARLSFFLIGKFFMACLFGALYSYTADLFPTTVRSAIVGMCSTSGRLGGILAPVIADGGKAFYPALPYIVFAVVNILVGCVCLLLPDTDDQPLPKNIEEAISFSKR